MYEALASLETDQRIKFGAPQADLAANYIEG